jgi:DNA-directed RNA polymerase specialized sigma24 family protein
MADRGEPSRSWQDELFKRIVDKDPIAFPELCEQAIPHLVAELEAGFGNRDPHLILSVTHDLLIQFQQNPSLYNPTKASLFTYLRMAARADMKNAIEKHGRHARRFQLVEDPDVELSHLDRNIEQQDDELEWLRQHTDHSPQEIIDLARDELDDIERLVAEMIYVEGIRETARFAEVMGLTHLDEVTQRREVKRMKDRIKKRLARLGDRMRRDDS